MPQPHFPPSSPSTIALIVALSSKLRSSDPAERAEFAERYVNALDRHGYRIEQVTSQAMTRAQRPAPIPPGRPMGQYNWLAWARFMLLSPLLTKWEREFIQVVMRRAFPSEGQRQKLREILLKVFPAGCGKWGLPKADPTC